MIKGEFPRDPTNLKHLKIIIKRCAHDLPIIVLTEGSIQDLFININIDDLFSTALFFL